MLLASAIFSESFLVSLLPFLSSSCLLFSVLVSVITALTMIKKRKFLSPPPGFELQTLGLGAEPQVKANIGESGSWFEIHQ